MLVARSEDRLAALCDELMLEHKVMAHYVAVDLTEYQSDTVLFEETEKHDLEVNWLINNAGFGSMGDFTRLDLENELRMITLNIMALVALTHRYLKKMRERKEGVIINVSSAAGFQPIPFMATYAATKAFVTSFSEAIAEENRPHNVKILNLCPGPTETGFFDAAGMEGPFSAAKGMQMPDEVVETAMSAVKSGKTTAVSGWANYFVSFLGNFAPDWLVTRAVASQLRGKFDGKG